VKILYVSQYFPPEMGAPSARAAELARYWAQDGHQVTVLTGFPNHPTGVVPPEYRSRLRRLTCRENCGGVSVVRTWLLPLPNRKSHERMLNYGSFCVSAAVRGMFATRPDIVIATSPQLLVGLSGWWISRIKRVPLVFEVRDLWPESLTAVGLGTQNSVLNRTLSRVAAFLYQRSAHVVVVTPAFADFLTQNRGVSADKLSVVENGVDTDLFRPCEARISPSLGPGLEAKFVVGYIGTMGMAHGLGTLVDAAAELQRTMPEVVFLMVGEGAEKARAMEMAESQRLRNILWVGQQPRERIPEFIAATHVCLVPLKKTELFKTVIPTKMLEFMACARPVILGVDGQAREILDSAHAGVFVEPENSSALVAAIRKLALNPAWRESLGLNGRNYILQHSSRQQTARSYIAVLESVLNGKRQPLSAAA
jgi:glycosyltransferase involved in cell wall biosynthesis